MDFHKLDNGMFEGFALLKTAEQKTTAKGKPYMDFTLSDRTGEINAKLWEYKEGYTADMLVKVRGFIEPYNGKDQMKIQQIRPAIAADEVKMEDFVPSAPYTGEVLFDKLESIVRAFQDEDLKRLVLAMLDGNKEAITACPAAFRLHHAMRGGLLYHTAAIVSLAQSLCKIYPAVDEELLVSGAILHDLAKTEELHVGSTGLASGYTTQGELLGHLVKGAMNIEKAAAELGIPQEKALLLEHMVISHHEEPEFGAAMRPMFLEAEILASLDALDATIFEITAAAGKVPAGSFTDRQWALDNRKLYNHGRKTPEYRADFE